MHQSKQYASQNYGSCDSTFRLWKSSQQQIKHHSSEHQLLNEPYKADRDKEKDNVRHNTFYKSDSKVYNGFYITGIEDEATKICKDLGAYEQKIKQLISKEPISDFAKLNILQNIQFIQYYDRHVLMLSLSRDNEPYTYDEKLYTRQSSQYSTVTCFRSVDRLFNLIMAEILIFLILDKAL